MDPNVLSTAVVRIQCDDLTGNSIVEEGVILITYINFNNVDATKQNTLGENECGSNYNRTSLRACNVSGARDHDSTNVAELECLGRTYMCGNCKMVLKLKEESDLEKQLNVQRIQHQIELEALQHEQRMKHLRTLLLS